MECRRGRASLCPAVRSPRLGEVDHDACQVEVPAGRSWVLAPLDLRDRLDVALLLDFGNSPSDDDRKQLTAIAKRFLERLGPWPKAAVYLSDGAESRDSSVDLHSAYLQTLDELRNHSGLRLPVIIVIARNPDLAARAPRDRVETRANQSPNVDSHVILVGPTAQKAGPSWLASASPVEVNDLRDVNAALGPIVSDLQARAKSALRVSVVSFCARSASSVSELHPKNRLVHLASRIEVARPSKPLNACKLLLGRGRRRARQSMKHGQAVPSRRLHSCLAVPPKSHSVDQLFPWRSLTP
jgi:hypothetical protein